VVAETENVLAFRHPRPRWPVHVVVIPKRHVASLLALGPEDAALLAEVVAVIQTIAERVLAEQGGCQVIANLGDYQTNKHLHWHVRSGDPVR
jgi:histidine triad (HIT) family protein